MLPVSHAAFALLLLIVSIWAVGFLLTRFHILHVSYTKLAQQRDDEEWLLKQCKHDEFYHNMKQHSQLCDQVSENAQSNLLLGALEHMVQSTYLCGYDPCLTVLDDMVTWATGRGFPVTATVLIGIVFFPAITLPFWRRRENQMAARGQWRHAYGPLE